MDASRRPDSSEPGRRTGENLGRLLAWTQAGARIRVSLEGERVRIWAGGLHGRKPAPGFRVSLEGERVRIWAGGLHGRKPAPGFRAGTPSLRVKCSGQLSYAGAAAQFRRPRGIADAVRRRASRAGPDAAESIDGVKDARTMYFANPTA